MLRRCLATPGTHAAPAAVHSAVICIWHKIYQQQLTPHYDKLKWVTKPFSWTFPAWIQSIIVGFSCWQSGSTGAGRLTCICLMWTWARWYIMRFYSLQLWLRVKGCKYLDVYVYICFFHVMKMRMAVLPWLHRKTQKDRYPPDTCVPPLIKLNSDKPERH